MPSKQVRAIGTFACEVNGRERIVHTGDVLPATDPVVKARPELFEPAR